MENRDVGAGPLRGAGGWLITDDKVGMVVQCRGVADALGLDYTHKLVTPSGLAQLLSPWIGPARSERVGQIGSTFATPWTDIIIATGRLSIPYSHPLSCLVCP